QEIAESAYRFQQAVESRERIIVGVNEYGAEEDSPVPILYIDEKAAEAQQERRRRVKATRDERRVQQALEAMAEAAMGRTNTMEPILEAVRAYATVGEMCDVLRRVWGEYEEVPVI